MPDSDRPSPLEPGYRIDRYELLYAVAQGGMGSVWVARLLGKHGFEKLYAIKTILPQYASDEKFRTMFLDEARIASGIDHPNVVQVLDLGEQQGILYTVLEWVEGDSLQRLGRLAERDVGRFPVGMLMRIICDTCAGLHAAHELADADGRGYEIVHRDVSTGGRSKLIDFGVAKARDRLAGDTSQAVLKGKIRYAAIEQLLGNPVDRRADVWSMGAVLHTMLARSSPFPGESDVAILRGVLAGAEPLPVPEWVPKPVARIIDKCLQRDPAARFQSALELQQALESAMMECGLPCTSTEVGAFATELTRERIASRKTTLQLARRAVAERQRVRELLERPSVADPSGSDVSAIPKPELGPTDTRVGPSSLRPANVRRAPTASPDEIEVELGEPATRIVKPAASALSTPLDSLETERLANGTSEVTSTQASISIVGERASSTTSRRSLVAVGGLIVAVLAAILVVLVVRGPGTTGPSNAAPGSVATADTTATTIASPLPSATSTASATPPATGSIAALPSASSSADVPPAAHATRTLAKPGSPGKPPGNPGSRPTATANRTGGELGGTIDSRK